MPSFRKLSEAEIPANPPTLSARAQVAQMYDALLADFVIGAYGRVELVDGERRTAVRSRLHAAARRRGLALRFRPGPGPGCYQFHWPTAPTQHGSVPDVPLHQAKPTASHLEMRSIGNAHCRVQLN